MNKRAIAILGAIFLLIIGTLGFLIFSKKKSSLQPTPIVVNTTPTTTPLQNTPTTTPAQALGSAITKLTSDQVVSPALFFDGTGVTYFDNQGNLFQATFSDNSPLQFVSKKQLDIPLKAGISKIYWPPKGNDFIAEFSSQAGAKTWSYFNSQTRAYVDLPPQVESFDWLPGGTQILYVWLQNGKSTLNVGNPDASNWKYLADMWENDDSIHISPDGSQIIYYETQNSSASNAINSVTADGKVWKALVQNGQNMGVQWSPDGQKFLFGKKDLTSQNYQLWVYNITSGEVKNLGLFTTPDKAAWDKNSSVIYAAVPTSGSAGGGSLTTDSFFRMDTSSLEKKQYVSDSSTAIDGRNLFLNSAGDKLFFKNAQDGGLYYLDLTQQN